MANGNLIQGARRIGQARRFVDYGKIIGDNIKSPALTQYFEEARAQYFQNIKEKEAKLANFINQKAYMDMSKINEYNVDMASGFLSDKKAEYLEAANIAATASVGSDEYVSAVSKMNAANNCIKNFDVNLQAWRDQDGEKTLDFDNNKISKGNLNYGDIIETMQKPGGKNGPTFAVGDCGKVTMIIKDAEGNVIKELERQEYFLKVTDNEFYKLGEIGDKYYNVGLNGLGLDEKRARQDVRRWMGEDHTKLLSLARDDFDEMPAFIKDEDLEVVVFNGLTGRELLQKNNQTELKSFLVDKYIGALKDRHTAGTGDFNTIKAREDKEKNTTLKAPSKISDLISNGTVRSTNEFGEETRIDEKNTNRNIALQLTQDYPVGYGFDTLLSREAAFQMYKDGVGVSAWQNIDNGILKEIIEIESRLPNQELDAETLKRLNIEGAAIGLYMDFKKKFGNKELFQLTSKNQLIAPTVDLQDDNAVWVMLNQLKMVSKNQAQVTTAYGDPDPDL